MKVKKRDVETAKARWFEYWGKSERHWYPFWGWLGAKNKMYVPYDGYDMSIEAARKIAMLNGPHCHTLLKALEVNIPKK